MLLYIIAMWAGGLTEGLMSRALTPEGLLLYPNFVDIVARMNPFFWTRVIGGTMYLVGAILMAINLILTIRASKNAPALTAAAQA
jgi:cytochrome c oxidase cbb3-type subunit I/II